MLSWGPRTAPGSDGSGPEVECQIECLLVAEDGCRDPDAHFALEQILVTGHQDRERLFAGKFAAADGQNEVASALGRILAPDK